MPQSISKLIKTTQTLLKTIFLKTAILSISLRETRLIVNTGTAILITAKMRTRGDPQLLNLQA